MAKKDVLASTKKSLMETLLSTGSQKIQPHILTNSPFVKEKDIIKTSIPLLNIALSGNATEGGWMPGLTIFGGERATFKTKIALELVRSYLDKHKDGVCVFYDSEFGASFQYFQDSGINTDRVIHVGIEHVENLKFDMSKKLDEINRGDKVVFIVDSIGMLASKKEIEDAIEEKSVADMSRAKALRSFFRIITPKLNMKDLHCVVIAHTYQTMEMYAKTIISGGTAPMYAANEVFVISKSKEREEKLLVGYDFTLNVMKSRTIMEESKFPISVNREEGVMRNSGLIEISLEAGILTKPKQGWFQFEGTEKLYRYDDLLRNNDIWDEIIKRDGFSSYVKNHYCLSKD